MPSLQSHDERKLRAGRLWGTGEMADLTRAYHWASTPLGSVDQWPELLLNTVNTLLSSRQPMFLWWGEDLIQFYNDAYRPNLGADKHPLALGQRGQECWPEIWPVIGPLIDAVMKGGEPHWSEDQLIPIYRDGKLEDVYWTFSYSPVWDSGGRIRGTLVVCSDTTKRVVSEKAVLAERARLLEVLQQSPGFFALLLGPDHVISMVNEHYLQLVNNRDVLGKPVRIALPEAAEQGYVQILDRVYAGEPYVAQGARYDGFAGDAAPADERYLDFVYQPLRGSDGVVTGIIVLGVDVTERKHAEQNASKAHQSLENVLNSITDGLAVIDKDWQFAYVNTQGARMLGMTVESLVGCCAWDVFPHTLGAKFQERFRSAIESGEPAHFEEFYPEPLNKWLECHSYPSADGLSVYFRDVTERKSTDKALNASESRYRKLFQSDLLGICVPDRFGGFLEGNDEFLRIIGYTRQDLEAGLVRWDIMTPPEYNDLDAAHIAEAAERGSCSPYEKEYVRKDGSRVPIACGYTLLEGSQDVYIAFIQDLSLQKQAEAGLREREQRFRVLAESLPEFVWIRNPKGEYVYCNQRLLDYVGQSAEWLQSNAFEAVHPDDLSSTIEKWKESLATGKTYLNEYRLRRYDGVYRNFLARAVAIRDEAGRIERWLGSTTDVHEQKLAEEALRRTEKLNTAARLASSMAHEINNPLTSVTNTLYLALQDTTLNDVTLGYLRLADRELARAVQVTTQMLRFHKQSTASAMTDVSEVMDGVLALYAHRLDAYAIVVEREYLTHERLRCFNDELRQAFANLVGNSLDAIKRGGRLRIRISDGWAWNEAHSRGIRVTVADTGDGIPRELQETVFEPFVTTKEATGTGLGLWVTQGIVKKHKGRIALRSTTDPVRHGTVFSLFLPFGALDT